MTITIYPKTIDASTIRTGMNNSLFYSLLASSSLTLGLWYYLKFNPKGKLAFANLETKIRDYHLSKTRKEFLKK